MKPGMCAAASLELLYEALTVPTVIPLDPLGLAMTVFCLFAGKWLLSVLWNQCKNQTTLVWQESKPMQNWSV